MEDLHDLVVRSLGPKLANYDPLCTTLILLPLGSGDRGWQFSCVTRLSALYPSPSTNLGDGTRRPNGMVAIPTSDCMLGGARVEHIEFIDGEATIFLGNKDKYHASVHRYDELFPRGGLLSAI